MLNKKKLEQALFVSHIIKWNDRNAHLGTAH